MEAPGKQLESRNESIRDSIRRPLCKDDRIKSARLYHCGAALTPADGAANVAWKSRQTPAHKNPDTPGGSKLRSRGPRQLTLRHLESFTL
jgi:hypothetical protein